MPCWQQNRDAVCFFSTLCLELRRVPFLLAADSKLLLLVDRMKALETDWRVLGAKVGWGNAQRQEGVDLIQWLCWCEWRWH